MIKPEALIPSLEIAQRVRRSFAKRIVASHQNGFPRFQMLPSFLELPTGGEEGSYLAIDFGGTKVRCMKVKITKKMASIQHEQSLELSNISHLSGKELLLEIANSLADFTSSDQAYDLGHVFSYAGTQKDPSELTVSEWSKEVEWCELLDEPINQLLQEALIEVGRPLIRPVVILNDVVATLIAGAYQETSTQIGVICGTGHNIAYFAYDLPQGSMCLNLEAADFDEVPRTLLDEILDEESLSPKVRYLEKQVGGKYLSELARLGLAQSFDDELWCQPYSISSEMLASWLTLEGAICWLAKSGIEDKVMADAMNQWAEATLYRSAAWTAVGIGGTYDCLQNKQSVKVIIDGSLFIQISSYRKWVEEMLEKLEIPVDVFCIEEASALGGAIAAGMLKDKKT